MVNLGYEEIARPFEWKFTRKDLANLIEKLADQAMIQKIAA